MPEYLHPGVYIEETSSQAKPIEGVPTSTAGFVGAAPRGLKSRVSGPIGSLGDFEQAFGGGAPLEFADESPTPNFLWHAVRAFFENGGRRCYVARAFRRGDAPHGARPGPVEYKRALGRLAGVAEIALVAVPGSTCGTTGARNDDAMTVALGLIRHAEKYRRFALIDPPGQASVAEVRAWRARFASGHAALYYPWLTVAGPTAVPPSGFIAGIYARVDAERGVHKALANEAIRGAVGTASALDHPQQELLNPESINALRFFGGRGLLVWGARTLSGDPEWRYVNVRRLFLYLERSIEAGLAWTVFEPNGEPLWARVQAAVEDFVDRAWRDGALLGNRADEAYFVRCDRSTMTQGDIDAGRLIVLVGAAPLRPAEFVELRVFLRTRSDEP